MFRNALLSRIHLSENTDGLSSKLTVIRPDPREFICISSVIHLRILISFFVFLSSGLKEVVEEKWMGTRGQKAR